MLKSLLFTLALTLTGHAMAQTGFEKYYWSTGSYQFSLSEMTNHDFIVALEGAVITGPNGSIIHNNYYWADSILGLQSVRKNVDSELYFAANYRGEPCVQDGIMTQGLIPVIGKMDSLGHVLDLSRYLMNVGCQNVAGDLEITSDKGVITWGREWSFFALRADSNLAHVWSKYFDHLGGFQFIKELPSGDLLAGINMDTAGAVVARLDANGNFLWCKSYIRPKGMVHDCLIESDSSFVITGYTDSLASTNVFALLPPDYNPKLFMMKLDGAGAVQWCKGYESEPKWYVRKGLRIVRAQDDNYVVLANIGVQDHNRPLHGFLMKTDQNGDTLWTRSAGVTGYSHSTSNLLACSDGGFLSSGTAYGDFGMWSGLFYLFKTDSLGHLTCSEKQPPPIAVSDLFPTDSSFTISSVDGAVAQPIFVQDTVYGTIPVINGCTFTTGLNPMRQPRKFQLYPNPNTGRFTMEFKDPLAAESFYSVYDAMGRLLYQRPLPPGATVEEIDLSRFGKGTYLVKVTDKVGVCYERVVVE